MPRVPERRPTAVLTLACPPAAAPLSAQVRDRIGTVEVRMDLVPESDWAGRPREVARAFPHAALLLTVRLARDGGRWPDERPRGEALRRLLDLHRWDFLDLEDDRPERDDLLALARDRAPGTGIVLSRHAFAPRASEEASDELESVLRSAREHGAAVAKWAGLLADPERDAPGLLRRLAAVGESDPMPAFFPMGPGSEPWRVAASLAGRSWGYAHDGSGPAAPGQLPWAVFDALVGSLPPPPTGAPDDGRWTAGVRGATELALRAGDP